MLLAVGGLRRLSEGGGFPTSSEKKTKVQRDPRRDTCEKKAEGGQC